MKFLILLLIVSLALAHPDHQRGGKEGRGGCKGGSATQAATTQATTTARVNDGSGQIDPRFQKIQQQDAATTSNDAFVFGPAG